MKWYSRRLRGCGEAKDLVMTDSFACFGVCRFLLLKEAIQMVTIIWPLKNGLGE
jgi:hypothetical protein